MFFVAAQLTRALTLVHVTSRFRSVCVLDKRHFTRSTPLELSKLVKYHWDSSGIRIEDSRGKEDS